MSSLRLCVSVVQWILALMLVPGRVEAAVRAGVGRAEITPPVGTPLGGYGNALIPGRPATGTHDPLFAKALVLDDGTTRVAIVATDLIGTNPEITRRGAARTGFPPARLPLSASHTPSRPRPPRN